MQRDHIRANTFKKALARRGEDQDGLLVLLNMV
jgi:hypothetical protein